MKDELSRDVAQLEKDEAAAVAGFTDMKGSKEKEVEFADESIESKKERVGVLAVEIVKNKDEVEDSAAEAAAVKKSLPAAAFVQSQPEAVPSGYRGHRNMFTGEMT